MIDIIILKYNLKEYEDRCIRSVLEHTDVPYHLTVYDNYIHKHTPSHIWNRLINQSDAPYVCLLNSDTLVSPAWTSKLLETFEKYPNAACVGPSTNNSANHQSKTPPNETFVDYGAMYPQWTLSGFCLVIKKSIFDEIGGFSEEFGFYGQEVNLLDRFMYAGYKQIWRTDVYVHHYGSKSMEKAQSNGEIDELNERRKARDIFQKKRRELENKYN